MANDAEARTPQTEQKLVWRSYASTAEHIAACPPPTPEQAAILRRLLPARRTQR